MILPPVPVIIYWLEWSRAGTFAFRAQNLTRLPAELTLTNQGASSSGIVQQVSCN